MALGTLACFRLQAQQVSTSLIETIVGSNNPDVVGSEFSLGTVGSLVTDAVGNLYFSQPSLGQVFRAD